MPTNNPNGKAICMGRKRFQKKNLALIGVCGNLHYRAVRETTPIRYRGLVAS